MITYIVKALLCATVLFLVYVLLLEREKMHRFNRFYLLFSIVFSFTVALITIKSNVPIAPISKLVEPIMITASTQQAVDTIASKMPAPSEERNLLPQLLLFVYVAITLILLFRFVRNLVLLLSKVKYNESIKIQDATLILTNDQTVPHSFLQYIFIDKKRYKEGAIEKEILQHELTHVHQKHSIDILMVELLMVFAWINPLLFLYRKAIMLNHEYLADDAVVNRYNDVSNYQLLLFQKINRTNNLILSSPFNYLLTKKRFIMMTRQTSQKVAILKQIAVIPLIAAIGFLFSTRVIAQDAPKQSANQQQYEPSKIDAPQSVIDEYNAILAKYDIDSVRLEKRSLDQKLRTANAQDWIKLMKIDTLDKLDKSDRARLESLFFKMSYKQRTHQLVAFSPKPAVPERLSPTKEQINSWKNTTMYGVWINGRRVKNAVLNDHPNTYFAHYDLRELDPKTAKAMKYNIEVALYTNKWFEYNRNQILASWKRNDYKTNLIFQLNINERLSQVIF